MSSTSTIPLAMMLFTILYCPTGCFQSGGTNIEMDEIKAYVEVQPVQRGELIRSLDLTGTVKAIRQVDLVTNMAGKVKSIPVKVGQQVGRGELLVQLDTDMAQLQAQQAAAAVRLAELSLATAQREFQRASSLHEKGSMPDQAFEQAQAGVEMAQQQLAQGQAALGLVREQIRGSRLVAPFDGVVTYIAAEENEYFNPMTISPMAGFGGLVGLVDDSAIKIDLQVADSDITSIRQGMSARIFVDALADREPRGGLLGSVDYVGIAADSMSRTFPVRVVADNPDHAVLVGTHARVDLVLESRAATLYLPESAIRGERGERYVMVLDGERAYKVEVTTGMRGGKGIEITEGLTEGQMVITRGNFGLPDGALVEVSS